MPWKRTVGLCLWAAAAAVLLMPCAFAGDSTFTVESFIPARFVDNELRVDGSIGMNGNGSEIERDTHLPPEQPWVSRQWTDSNNDAQRFRARTQYTRRWETIPKYCNFGLYLSTAYDRTSSDEEFRYSDNDDREQIAESHQEASEYGVTVGPTFDAGLYVSGNLFVSTTGSIQYIYEREPDATDDSDSENSRIQNDTIYTTYSTDERILDVTGRSCRIDASALIGWGRVYEGEFAATALYMLGELRGDNLLVREPSYEQMQKLTGIVYDYRQRHVVDSRTHRIEALTAVMEYLADEGVIDDPGPYGHFAIQDVWDYFPRGIEFPRRFGLRIRGGIGLDYSRQSRQRTNLMDVRHVYTRRPVDLSSPMDTTSDSEFNRHDYRYNRSKNQQPYLMGMVEYYKPLSARWQLDLSGSIEHYFSIDNEQESDYVTYGDPTIRTYVLSDYEYGHYNQLSLSGAAKYIISSRSTMTASLGYALTDYNREIWTTGSYDNTYPDDPEDVQDYRSWQVTADMRLAYRLAIPTTLTMGLTYTRRGITDDRRLESYDSTTDSYSLSAGVTHWVL